MFSLVTSDLSSGVIEYNFDNKFRPFCSERCQLMDLGDWANENYKIPDNSPPNTDDELN
jgi:endogenous inhibitor of DNA gyrase (YacG/DUF329 family)